MPAPRTKQPRPQSVAEQHAEWLSLLRPEGPFLALPVITEAFPQGLDTVPDETRARIRQAWAEVSEAPDLLGPAWQDMVIGELLGYPSSAMRHAVDIAAEFPGLRPDDIVDGPDPAGGKKARLHLYRRGIDEPLTSAVLGQPALAERAAQLCRDTRTPLALLTNGQLWVLVHARPGEATSFAVFDADLWFEEPTLLRAFASLVSASRVLRPAGGLAELFARSVEEHTHVTHTLGGQVRQAVELFVAELARLDRESGGELLAGVSERDSYRGALTALMRLVFLLFAEEQRLLPVADPIYADGYAVSKLYDQLDAERALHGDEEADRRSSAWPRLLALFDAIHGGCEHPDLRIPAYGGSLFDPATHPWLAKAAIVDRVTREMLDALLMLRHKGRAAERLSYARLGVEQIGHVYEGLLEYSCRRVSEPFLGLRGKAEPELPLAEVESAAAGEEFRDWLRMRCDATEKQVEKWLSSEPSLHQRAALHAACDNDAALAERILPFWGLLREDLRGLPTVFPAGSVLFTQVGDRRATGTHYTPRELAEEVVQHTLAPLCFAPGPAEGAEPRDWRAKSANSLLELKVVDPAMGSGAFLVSACRYLADRVVDAWDRDGIPDDVAALLDTTDDREGLTLAARRLVAARCIYGVDRDDMAVELAKLSLWLVTLAKNKPFGFLDHALRCGDSLVGLVSQDQLARFHMDSTVYSTAGSNLFRHLHDKIEMTLTDVTEIRREIEATVVKDAHHAAEKAELLANAEWMTRKLNLTADAIVGAALSTAGESEERLDDRLDGIADKVDQFLREQMDNTVERHLRDQVTEWLRGTRPEPIRPLHWPLEFPEVMRRGGFHAVVGNPPFIGGTMISGRIGKDLLKYFQAIIAKGQTAGGRADLCTYFLLRDLDLCQRGRVGIIATNTVAQGDTREVGLDQAISNGWHVYRAIKSQPWPGTANLEVSMLWVGRVGEHEPRHLDGIPVRRITSSLDPQSRVSGRPYRLEANMGQSFQGCKPLGMGFVLSPEQAQGLIDKDTRNKAVLFPYLNGEDLTTRPDCSASRWVIDFNDWPIEKAAEYQDVFSIVESTVRPERQRTRPDGSYALRKPLPQRWWQYADRRPALRKAIKGLDRILAIAFVSKSGLPLWVPTGQVYSHMVGLFAVDRSAFLCLLSSNEHLCWWTIKARSTLETRLLYTPSDGFDTFPQPELTERMDRVGEELDSFRRSVMLGRQLGLTKLYNLVHDPVVHDTEVRRLREIHTEIDYATAEAYGWDDLDLGLGFHETRQGRRFTIAPDVQVEVLDRLLELNHQRYAEEVAQGLHTKKKGQVKRARRPVAAQAAATLFGNEGTW